MKKTLKITGIVLLGLVVIAGILALIFPGAVYYFQIKNLKKVNVTSQPYPYTDVTVPEDWQEITAQGLTLRIPAEMTRREDTAEDAVLIIYRDNIEEPTVYAAIYEETEWDDFSLAVMQENENAAEIAALYEAEGVPYPQSHCEMLRGFYRISMDDFNIHSYREAGAFAAIAYAKEMLLSDIFSAVYETEIDDCPAFIQESRSEGSTMPYRYLVEVYGGENHAVSYAVTFGAADEAVARQMVASVQFAE